MFSGPKEPVSSMYLVGSSSNDPTTPQSGDEPMQVFHVQSFDIDPSSVRSLIRPPSRMRWSSKSLPRASQVSVTWTAAVVQALLTGCTTTPLVPASFRQASFTDCSPQNSGTVTSNSPPSLGKWPATVCPRPSSTKNTPLPSAPTTVPVRDSVVASPTSGAKSVMPSISGQPLQVTAPGWSTEGSGSVTAPSVGVGASVVGVGASVVVVVTPLSSPQPARNTASAMVMVARIRMVSPPVLRSIVCVSAQHAPGRDAQDATTIPLATVRWS